MSLSDFKFHFNQTDIDEICKDRDLDTRELHPPNDFYGQAAILKRYVGRPDSYRLKGLLEHAPLFSKTMWDHDRDSSVGVSLSVSAERGKLITELSGKKSIPIGFGYYYAIKLLEEQFRQSNSMDGVAGATNQRRGTVVFPFKSTHVIKTNFDHDDYAKKLINLPEEFQPVVCCIFWKDYLHGSHLPYLKAGVPVISAGHMFDRDFLLSFHDICRQFKYAVSNEMGSYVFLSVASGCPFFYLDSKPISREIPEEFRASYCRDDNNFEKVTEQSKILFQNPTSQINPDQQAFVDRIMGKSFVRTREQLAAILQKTEYYDKCVPFPHMKDRPVRWSLPPYFKRKSVKLANKVASKIRYRAQSLKRKAKSIVKFLGLRKPWKLAPHKVYGELPTSPVVYAACDSEYFLEFAPSFVESASQADRDVHLHVVNPTDEVNSLACYLNAVSSTRVTYSFEEIELPINDDQRKTYFACARFLALPEILRSAHKVLTLDIDCVIKQAFEFPEMPVGYFPRGPIEGLTGWHLKGTRCAAGVVYFENRGLHVAEKVAAKIRQTELRWFADQFALTQVIGKLPAAEVHAFDESFMDWEFKDGTTIWTGKGPRKYDNPDYIAQSQSFKEAIMSRSEQYHAVLLKPRLDLPFKKSQLIAGGNPMVQIRKHWERFAGKMEQAHIADGVPMLTVESPRWMFHKTIQNLFSDETKFLVPHAERQQFDGNDLTQYYMQTVFPWLFTIDPVGWGGGSKFVETFDPTADYSDESFNHLQKYVEEGGSKFEQPKPTVYCQEKQFVFVPLQLPHDEVIRYHSDVSVPEFVESLCQWADSSEACPKIVFKGHPINLESMKPLRQIIESHRNVEYVEDVHIHEMIRSTAATFVINSGAGQEAMLFDKPVVCFGRSEYQAAVIRGDLARLDEAWQAVQQDDYAQRSEMYRRWYDWYLNDVTFDSREATGNNISEEKQNGKFETDQKAA